jgi:iron complex outermembrane recepter protein
MERKGDFMIVVNSQTNARFLIKSSIALAVLSLSNTYVVAQTLSPVVVSASRAEQRSFDAPAAVVAIDAETIQNAGPQVNLSESLNRVPGLTILNRQNYAQDLQVSIRGFGARSAFGIRGIRLLVDGIPATTPDGQGQGSSISLTSTERIEVLRGPLAQLYGNSSGGVIQAFTREAPAQPEVGAQLYGGSYGIRRTDWQYAGVVGKVGLVADYSTFGADGFRANSTTERKQFNGKVSFDAGDATKVNVIFNRFDMPLALDPTGLTAAQLAADPTQAGTNTIARNARKIVVQNQLGTSIKHNFDADRSLTARLYSGTRDNTQYQTGAAAATGAWVGLERSYSGAGLQYNALSKIGTTPVTWVVGYEYDRSKETRQGGVAALGEKTTTTRNEDNQASNSDMFVQATALVSEQISVVGGLRYSSVNFKSSDNFLKDGDGSGSTSYKATSPVLGVTYHANDSLNLYANYGKGFESPTLAEVAYKGAATPAFNTSINASKSKHYEIGAKWLPNATSRLDMTLFQINSTDEIVVASNTGGNSTFKNAPGTKRTGWELSGNTLLMPNLRATLAASQTNATFSETFTTGTTSIASGNKIPGIPQSFVFSELLWTSKTMSDSATNRNIASKLGAQAGIELTHAGRLYANDTNTATADGYNTLALKASYGWAIGSGVLTASARVDNATDKRYVGSVIVNQAASQFYEPAPGRNWTVGLRFVLPL